MLFEDFHNYLVAERHLNSNTARFYLVDVAQFSEFLKKDIYTATADDIQAFINWLVEKGSKPRTIGRKVATLSTFFKWTTKTKRTEKSPIEFGNRRKRMNISVPLYQEVERSELTDEQVQNLLDIIKGGHEKRRLRDQILYQLLLFRGVRASEAQRAKVTDVNLDGNIMTIHRVTKGSGVPGTYTIDIAFLKDDLKQHIESLTDKDGLLFTNKHGNVISLRSIRRELAKFAAKAGIKANPTSLRFNFAVKRSKTDNIRDLSDRLGHSSLITTKLLLKKKCIIANE